MNVWHIELEEHWSYHEEDEYQGGDAYNVTANTPEEAQNKAIRLAGVGHTEMADDKTFTLEAVRVIRLERGLKIDA